MTTSPEALALIERYGRCRKGLHVMTPENTYRAPSEPTARRCRRCMKAKAARQYRENRVRTNRRTLAAWHRRKGAIPALAPDDPRHGTTTGYNRYRCRLDCCTSAIVEYHRQRRARLRQSAEIAALDRAASRSVRAVSLDAVAERRWGMDRIVGDEWSDPTFDEAAG